MKLGTLILPLALALVPLVSTATYVAGYREAKSESLELANRRLESLRANEWSAGVRLLGEVRAGTPDAVGRYERWIADQLAGVSVEALAQSTPERLAIAEAVKAVNDYRARHPDTSIDPVKDPRLASVLSLRP